MVCHRLTSLICAPAGNKVLPLPLLLPTKSRVKTSSIVPGITAWAIISGTSIRLLHWTPTLLNNG